MERAIGNERVYLVSERQIDELGQAIHGADHASDAAVAAILRDRKEGLDRFAAFARKQVAEVGPKSWMVKHLIDMLEDELRWLSDLALKIDPPEGSS